jgi:hypothetical protein
MANEKKSFSELLGEAPLAANEDSIRLVGALGRSRDSGKFVLVLSAGGSVTLGVDAVNDYEVLGGVFGQTLIQVDVDRKRVPQETIPALGPAVPFALATPHQVPADIVAAIEAGSFGNTLPLGSGAFFRRPIFTGGPNRFGTGFD